MITWICIGLINLITLSNCEFNNLTALDAPPDFLVPYCGFTQFKKKRPRVAFVSHDSASSTFYQNPEQGSRDAAGIVDLDIEWNRYLFNSGARMAKDIDTAVKNVIHRIYIFFYHLLKMSHFTFF
jgi:hypothetical protein